MNARALWLPTATVWIAVSCGGSSDEPARATGDAAAAGAGAAAAVEPPRVAPGGLEPPLARAIEGHTARVRAEPDSAAAWGDLGVVLAVHDLAPQAIQCLERARELEPDQFHWAYFLGHVSRAGDQHAALEAFQRAVELRPDYAPAHFYVGHGLLQLEQLDAAEAALARALELDQGLVAARLGLARVALAREDAVAALAQLEQAGSDGPRTAEIQALLAATHRLAGDDERAAEHAALVEGEPSREPVLDPEYDRLGWQYGVTLRWRRARSERHLRRGEVAEALREWEKALAEDPEWADAHQEQAELRFRTGDFEGAIASFDRVLGLDPQRARAHQGRGNALARAGRTEEAIAALREALRIDPELRLAQNMLGTLLVSTGDPIRGILALQASCNALQFNADAHFNLAMAYRGLNRPDEAEKVFAGVLRIDPEHSRAWFERGVLRAEQGRMEEAARDFAQVVALQPDLPSAHANLTRAYRALGRFADALAASRAGLERAPGDRFLRSQILWLLATAPPAEVRDGAEARAMGEALCEESGYRDPDALQLLAAACAEVGDFEQAVEHAARAVELARGMDSAEDAPQVKTFLDKVEGHLAHYRAGEPVRDPQ